MTLDFLDDTQADYEAALVQTGFGKFHYYLLAVCGLIYLNTAIGITILSFVLPSATCGKCFNSISLGWLSMPHRLSDDVKRQRMAYGNPDARNDTRLVLLGLSSGHEGSKICFNWRSVAGRNMRRVFISRTTLHSLLVLSVL